MRKNIFRTNLKVLLYNILYYRTIVSLRSVGRKINYVPGLVFRARKKFIKELSRLKDWYQIQYENIVN